MRVQPAINNETKETIFVNWDKSKVVKNSLCNGKHYATYNDLQCTDFNWWLKRDAIVNQYHLRGTLDI
jgi:hypothetical protein